MAETKKTETKTEKDLVEIELFRDNKDYKDDVFVCVNGKAVQIQRGKKVKVEKKYAEVLANSEKQDKMTADLMDKKADDFAEETKKLG